MNTATENNNTNPHLNTSQVGGNVDSSHLLKSPETGFDQIVTFLNRHFWFFAILLIMLIGGAIFSLLYMQFSEFRFTIQELTGQASPANSFKNLIVAYKKKDLDSVEKYVDINSVVDNIVDDIVAEIRNDTKFSLIFGSNDIKEVLNSKLDGIRRKYKSDIRNSIKNGSLNVDWKLIGKIVEDDKFDEALNEGNLKVNGNLAEFEIVTDKGKLDVKMRKVEGHWVVYEIIARDGWSVYLEN